MIKTIIFLYLLLIFVIKTINTHVFPPQFYFGGRNNDWLNNDNSKDGSSNNYDSNHEDWNTGRRQPPCEYPPTSTTQGFPFQGGFNFGNPPVKNPFIPPEYNKNYDFNIFGQDDNNPLFRGGLVIGSPPNFRNPFIPSGSDKHGERRTNHVNKAKFWCSKYQTKCRAKEKPVGLKPRIIGGSPALPRDHTHMVMIGYGNADDKHWLCGGSLISSKYVLTAAHCSTTGIWGTAKWARVGDLDVSSRNEDARPQERIIVKHYIYPDYKEPAIYHDIAIFKLDNEVTMNEWVSPICLHTSKEISITHVVVTGWGRTDFVGETSPILREVEIGLYNNTECKQLMDSTAGNKLPRGIDTDVMLCAGVSQGGKDACTGDSGGPLIIETAACSKVQIGITSIGRECGLPNSPGVYTRISHYIRWIESIVWP